MTQARKKENRGKYMVRLWKTEGTIAVLIRILQKIQKLQRRSTHRKKHLTFLADIDDIINVNWSTDKRPRTESKEKPKKPCTVAWVMSPPGESGGGHQNIFRFIKFLDDQGYKNHIYLYSTTDFPSEKEVQSRIKGFYDLKLENVSWLDTGTDITKGDALFATGWETAYAVFNAKTNAKKFYFVQDFEPLFYPMGSEYILAENTYKFGFTGITAGKWLATKLASDYGMKCHNYDFGSEGSLYAHTNHTKRKEVFFYARPITARRGFELGILALQKFHKMHPDYVINLAGWDVSEYDIPFPYVNHKALKLHELSDLYNRCATALVLSLTNMSLLPLELLSSGVIPVVNEGTNNRMVSDNSYIKYTEASPDSLAQAMHEIITMDNPETYAKKAARSVKNNSWLSAGEKFVKVFEEELYG